MENHKPTQLIGAFETFGEADAVGFFETGDLNDLDETVDAIEQVEGVASVETLPELEVP